MEVLERPTTALPRKPSARSSTSTAVGSTGFAAPHALGPAADEHVVGSERRSAVRTAWSPDTRKRPPRFFAGSTTRTGNCFDVGAKENMGLKKRSEDLPHSPSTRSTQGAPGVVHTARPVCAVALRTMAVELVKVRR